jgi:hypothetical protein
MSDLVLYLQNKIQETEKLFLRICDLLWEWKLLKILVQHKAFQYTFTELIFKTSGHPLCIFNAYNPIPGNSCEKDFLREND